MQHKRMRRYLHNNRLATAIDHFPEERMKIHRFRSRALQNNRFVPDKSLSGADITSLYP